MYRYTSVSLQAYWQAWLLKLSIMKENTPCFSMLSTDLWHCGLCMIWISSNLTKTRLEFNATHLEYCSQAYTGIGEGGLTCLTFTLPIQNLQSNFITKEIFVNTQQIHCYVASSPSCSASPRCTFQSPLITGIDSFWRAPRITESSGSFSILSLTSYQDTINRKMYGFVYKISNY